MFSFRKALPLLLHQLTMLNRELTQICTREPGQKPIYPLVWEKNVLLLKVDSEGEGAAVI